MMEGRRMYRKDAAKFLGCGETKLSEMVKSGLMQGTYYNLGNRYIFFEDDLLAWMKNGGEDGAKARLASRVKE